MSRLVLAIAVVPDVEVGRAVYHLDELADDGVYKAMIHLHNQRQGTECLPLHQYRIVAASAIVESSSGEISIVSLADKSEITLLNKLAELMSEVSVLISWGWKVFDRPILGYRCLKYGIACPALFTDQSEGLMLQSTLTTELLGTEALKCLSLLEMASVLGLPSQQGLEKLDKLAYYQQGDLRTLSNACDMDALNTFLVNKRLDLIRGELNNGEYQEDCDTLHTYLRESQRTHLRQFLTAWLPNNNK